jgi:phosphoglycolate phosphatase
MSKAGFYFDLDGTLIDSSADLLAATQHALTDNFNPHKPFTDVIALGSRAMLNQMALTQLSEQQLDAAQQIFLQYYSNNLDKHSVFYPDLDKLLLDLQHQKIPHGIVTNKSFALSQKLMGRLLPQWDGVIIGDQMENGCLPKPAPDRILKALELTQMNAENCFYFGDYPSDIEAAKRAGCHAVALKFGFYDGNNPPENWGADTVIDTPKQLIDFIKTTSIYQKC